MIIRSSQLEALAESQQSLFLDRLMDHFRRIWPARVEALGDGYRPFLEAAVRAARAYELNTEQQIARFTNLWFVWGPGFPTLPEHQWAAEILHDPERPPHVRIHQLVYETKMRLPRRADGAECS
jgi:hypothetical protein